MVAITAADRIVIRVTGQGVQGPPGLPGATVAHAPTHSRVGLGGTDVITLENLATGGASGSVPTSDGAGGVTMTVPSGSGNVASPGGETAGNLAEFTGANTIDETSITTASVSSHLVGTANPHSVTAVQAGAEPAGAIATHAADADAHHAESHTLASHSDTATTGPDLDAHLVNTANPHSVTAVQAGADPAGTATAAVSAHDGLTSAHAALPVENLTTAGGSGSVPTSDGAGNLVMSVPAGAGDFVGPAGAVANNLVGFADGTGKVGEDSGIAPGQVPTQGENDALVGTDGTPATGNPYVTDSDPRNTDSRVPSGSAGGDLGGTFPNPTVNDGADTTAIHNNVNGEFGVIADDVTPPGDGRLIAETAAGVKFRVDIGNLPTGGGGEANDLVNAGTGISGVATPSKVGLNLQARGYASGNDRITVTDDAPNENVVHTLNEGNIVHQNLSGAGTNTHAQVDTHIADTTNPHGTDVSNLGTGTLSQLNSVITDATLDTNTASRPPNGAAAGSLTGTYPNPGVADGADSTAIHDDTASEISAVTEKVTPVSGDFLLIEDSADSNNKKRVQVGNLPGGSGTDDDAIHDNVANEIAVIAEKVTPVGGDFLVIEDSADSNNKKRVLVGNLPSGGGGEANDLVNAGTGISGVASPSKVGINLQARGYASGNDRITVSADAPNENVVHTLNEGNVVHDNLSGSGSLPHSVLDAQTPTSDQKDALVGTDGTPATANPYVTDSDPRNTDARAPTAHTIVEHDTTATGAELTELTDGSTTALHEHAITGNEDLITGVLSGGLLSVNGGDSSLVDVAAGVGVVVDWTSGSPVRTLVTFGPFIAQPVSDISKIFTHFYVDAAGSLSNFSGVPPTPNQRKTLIRLQVALHGDGVNVDAFGTDRGVASQVTATILDYLYKIGPLNTDNRLRPNGVNLQCDKTAGTTSLPFFNATVDSQDAATTINPLFSPAPTLAISYRDGASGYIFDPTPTTINPNVFDDGSGVLAAVGPNDFTVLRFHHFGLTDTWTLTVGQETYNTLAGARASIPIENPDLDPVFSAGNSVLTTFLIVKQGTTDLTNASNAEFLDNTSLNGGAGSGVIPGTWLGLLDTGDTTYVGQSGKVPMVDLAETRLDLTQLDHAVHLDNVGTNDHDAIDSHISDVTGNPHAVTAAQAGAEPAGSVATHAALPDAHHDESHTIASHSDTSATGAQLDTLVGGGIADTEHTHADFDDSTFRIQDNLDPTKELAFQISGVTTGTVRTVTVPDASITIDGNTASRPPNGAAGGSLTGTFPNPGVADGADSTAIHDDTAAEFSVLAEKVTPVVGDHILIEDSAAGNVKRRVQVGNLPGASGTDDDAIHDNVANEIALIAEKVTPIGGDFLVIEDSADSNNKKRVLVGNLPGPSGVAEIQVGLDSDSDAVAIGATPTAVALDFSAVTFDAAVYTFSVSNTDVTINTTGRYQMILDGSLQSTSEGDCLVVAELFNTGVPILNAQTQVSVDDSTVASNGFTVTRMFDLVAGDVVGPRFTQTAGSGSASVDAGGLRFSLVFYSASVAGAVGRKATFGLVTTAPHAIDTDSGTPVKMDGSGAVRELEAVAQLDTDVAGGTFTFEVFHGPDAGPHVSIGSVSITQGNRSGSFVPGAPVAFAAGDVFLVDRTAIGDFPGGTAEDKQRITVQLHVDLD